MILSGCVEQCIGCRHRLMSLTDSLFQKKNYLKKTLAKWETCVEDITFSDKRWGYREKVSLTVQFLNGLWEFGIMRRDEFIPIPQCPVQSPLVNQTIALLKQYLPTGEQFNLSYYVQSGKQVVLVLKQKHKPKTDWCSDKVGNALTEIGVEGLWIHCNPSAGRRMFEKNNWHLVWGNERSENSKGLKYGPAAFQQVIIELYDKALQTTSVFFELQHNDVVVDLYCGIGSSMHLWSQKKTKIIGVELSGDAVKCATLNVSEALVLRGKCSERIPQLNQWLEENVGSKNKCCFFVNPPRTGLEHDVLLWITTVLPDKIAYLSCSAGTLARDLLLLEKAGYRITRIVPYDFFPQTHHVECLVLLIK
jgi:23S rRNA (uracil1939-C5)-methyltransferase